MVIIAFNFAKNKTKQKTPSKSKISALKCVSNLSDL